MKIKFMPAIICMMCVVFTFSSSFAQLTGVKSIPGDYATVSSAVAALNIAGVGAGGVTFNVAADYNETITATISLTATGTAVNPIIFRKDPATTGANPAITSYTTGVGTPSTAVQDGLWRLVGSDYVTIDGIDLKENPLNTAEPATMEYGYALYKATTSSGCQFVTIQNCVITLNRSNNAAGTAPMTDGSAGIIVMNALPSSANAASSAVSVTGSNSNNKFYSNTIQNCNIGISLIGYSAASPYTLGDTNNDVGGSTLATGNTIINYGGASGATTPSAGIRTSNQYGLNVSYNTINNNTGSGINHSNALRGILIGAAKGASSVITYNKITVKGGGTTQQLSGIENASGTTPLANTVNISNNLVTNCTYTTATTGSFFGISNSGAPTTLIISNDTVSNNSSSANSTVNTAGFFYEIVNSAAAASVTINNNLLTGNSAATSIGSFMGIYNSVVVPVININNNTIAGDSTATVTGLHYSIYNYGGSATANINSNKIGTAILPAIKFTAANAALQIFIYNYKSSAACALSISNNNITNIVYAITTAGSNTFISNSSATLSQVINSNKFTNLNVNVSGNITFISNAVAVSGTGKQNVDSNSIVGTFTKAAAGAITLFNGSGTSATGSIINNNHNNFSGITLTGATSITGFVNTDAGNSRKTIQNNVFSKWVVGTGAATVLNISLTGINNATTGNIISNIVSAGNIIGISTTGGNDNIYSNTIDTLITTGGTGATVTGISVAGGTTKNIYLNTIYGLQANAITTGSVKGIYISAGATINVFQNTINTLVANSITSGSVSGISVAAGVTVSVSRNKIYDLSSSSNLMSSAIVYGVQVSGTTASNTITIQNNLIGDLRTPFASAVDPIRGISIGSAGLSSTIKVYYNTVYLNGVSSGANFGSTGLYHLISGTSTTARLDLKNNIINNTSTATGTGLTVAYRRSGATLTNYDSTSNNNLFYAGTPAANKVIFTDGTTVPDQLLSTYKARVSPRDAQSVTEDMISIPKFISTSGSSPFFLHLDSSKTTQAESGGIGIAGITTDFDGQIRQGSTGYNGTGTAPDIGADETGASAAPALSGTYNVGAGQTYTSLTNAGGLFAGINSLGLSGNVVVNITSDLTEDGTNVLYQWVEKGVGNYTLTIQPDASAARLISGNVLAGMIRFNGAKRVIIDGSNGTANSYLTFRNTNTPATTGTAFTFINGATGNTIKYCNIEASGNATNGVVLFGTSTVAAGNSNNVVSNCNINATVAGVSGNICIYSAGTVGNENATNTISNNKIFNYRDRAIDIAATGSKSWTISGNSIYNGDVSGTAYAAGSTLHGIRILGGSSYTISNNYIGGNGALASGTAASYSSTGILGFWGILLTTTSASPASVITGNTVANISVAAVPTATGPSNIFIGIESNGFGISIGGPAATDGNIVGSNTINGSVSITTTTAATTYLSLIRGISCNSTGGLVTGNQVGGIDINNIGTAPAASTFSGIYVNNVTAPSQINDNIIGSSGTGATTNSIRVLPTSTSTTTLVTGIAIGSSVVSAVQIDGNLINNISLLNSSISIVTGGGFMGISSAATGAASVTITDNTISRDSIANYTTGVFYGIYNSGAATSISINNNTLSGNSSNSATGLYYAINNTGAVTSAININGNNIGNATTSAFTFNAINSGSQIFVNNAGGTAASTLSISNNNFQGINYFAAGTGNNTFIANIAATLSQTINGNTFTNLTINTAGSITFIANSVAVSGTGTQNVNNNSIAGTFTKKAAGTVTFFTSVATSLSGSVINNNSNNFSNITVTGATTIAGWVNTDAGASSKTIQNNTFSNWIGGTSAITALSVNLTGSNNAIAGNLISNISSAGPITGISTTAGNDNIFSNTIDTLTSNFAGAVTGIAISTAGTAINIYKNKIYDLSNSNVSGLVYGISVGAGTAVNIYNNLIGNFRTPFSGAADAIRGISITSSIASSAINVYFNTIYLNATSTVATFGTSGIFHTASATATTAVLNLRNNSITNTSTSNTGKTVAFRRSGAGFTNYAPTSNNNLFYAGVPASGKLVFFDGTSGDQFIAAYKTRTGVAPADGVSISEDLTAKFLSLAGSSSLFLHMSSTAPSGIESGGANIAGYTDDVDVQIRAGNPGYTGTSSSPDIGADEIFGIEATPPTITYTLLTNTTSTANRAVTGVSITDGSGVNVAAGTKPRIYYKRFSDANAWLDNSSSTNGWKYTEATNSVSPFTFTIDYSLLKGGTTVTAGAIQYFIVAQDIATTANVGINSGIFSATPSSVALTSSAFPITGTINSYTISYSGNYNVGASEIFTSLTKADGLFASINTAGLAGNIIVNITSNLTEDGANALNQWAESGVGNYTLTIKSSAATLRTISGNVVAGLIRLDGVDRVTFDGSISGSGKYLSFKNTNTAGTTGTAFTFINGASNNTIRYCAAEAYADSTDGVILFGSTTGGGNSNNLIDNCTINATVASNTGNVAIYSGGTAGNENVSDTISNNSIYGYRDRGLDITANGSSTWNISNNSFYNGNVTGGINYAASATLHGIRILGGSGYAIQNNYIGGSGSLSTGANAVYSSTLGNLSYQGILLTTGSSSPVSNIKGNTIAGITLSSVPTAANSNAFAGIDANGSGINVGGSLPAEGNTIGSLTANGSIAITTSTTSLANTSNITGINYLSSGGVVNNNRISGFDVSNMGTSPASSFLRGIYINNAAAPTQVNNNLIGSTSISNSIRVLPASTSATTSITGIAIGAAVNSAVQVNSNRIENISNLSTTSSGSFTGINNAATLSGAVITISSDTIQLIGTAANSNAGSTVYAGIISGSASTINNNFINNITLSSTGINAQIAGFNISGSYPTTVSGNIVSNFSTASTKANANVETGSPAGSAIVGILNSTTAGVQIINNNRFSGFSATSTAGVNVVVTGIGMLSSGSGNIFNNKLGTMINLATGAAPALCHIVATGGTFNVYNNVLRIGNLTNTNAMKVYGIIHASSTNWNYFHNSVKVTGNTGGAALRSAAFLLSGNSSPVLKDNIFFNIRTGTGANYAVSNLSTPPSNWQSTASDYNDLYSINSNTVAEWGSGAGKTFTQWQSVSGGDAHSINTPISFIITPYDLEPDSISNCAFVSTGTPITTPVLINTDINNKPRNPVTPDLGAYEFSYTGFVITAGSNSPICAGDSIYLTVDPGKGISPHFSWTNPANVVVSTLQNPAFLLTASGQYKVTVTDSTGCSETDSTLVLINQRPTAHITSQTSLCDSGIVYLNITVTGNGIINGTLSNGDDFSGTAPLIIDTVSVNSTTSFSVIDLSDSTCTAIPSDMPDTVTVTVTHRGDWLGITTNWHDPVNWCEGILPTSLTDITIPTGTPKMPVITDSVYCNSLTINSGDTLTIAATGTLNIAGTLTNSGTYTDNGTTNFNGTSGQQTFSGVNTYNNLVINNTSGLFLSIATTVKKNLTISTGVLNANNFGITLSGNWANNSSTTAFVAGTAIVTFSGTIVQLLGGTFATTFNNLTIANIGSTVILNVNTSISGILLVSTGTFDLASFTANHLGAGGTLNVVSNAFLKIGGTNTFPVNYATNTLGVTSTVEYSGTNQAVSNQAYGNLTVSSASGAATKTFPATDLIVVGNFNSIVGTGTSVSFTAASNININGNVSIGAATTFSGGSFTHTIGGNWTNSGTYTGNSSTVIFTGAGSLVSGAGTENFRNLTVAGSGVTFSANNITLSGNLATTGSGSFTQAAGGTITMTGTGRSILGSGLFINNLTISGSVTSFNSLNLSGNLLVTGTFTAKPTRTVTMSGISKTISGSGTIKFTPLNITGTITASADFSVAAGLTVSGGLSSSAGTVTFTDTSSLSGTANLFNINVNCVSFQLSAGSVLGVANVLTITSGILDVKTSGSNTINFNGAGSQNINSITYSNLVLSNGGVKSAVGADTVLFDITIGTGTTFNLSNYTLSVYGNWINNGTFNPGTSTVQFLGPATAYITGATTFNILTSNTTSASTQLILQNNISAAIVNMIKGVITTGSSTLTITNTRTGNGYIYGNIQRTNVFTTGVAYAFEGPDNTITFSALSSVSSITVSIIQGSVGDFPFGGSINRVYNITVPTGTYAATLRLHYEDNELNGNNESSMSLWHYDGSVWGSIGKTANSTTSNYVEQSGLTDITNRWTLSDNANLVQWNGSVSTDWNTAANWTVLQGSGSRPPSATDIVDLGTAAFTNQPTITSNVTVKNIIFGSVQPIVLTLGSAGNLTTLGNINGNWSGNSTHTINVNNQTLTINGDLDLSDGTTGHAINLNIGSGSVTILGSLVESGGANINFSGAGALNIYQNFTYGSGTFTAGGGTVTYDGNQNQDVANINYNNLTVNKAGGLASINNPVNIAGNLLVSSGELDNFSTTTIAGDVTINATDTLQNYQVLHVQGNWNNSGIYIGTGSDIYFDGSSLQTITASTFNNFIINKPVGSAAVLTGNIIINGDLTVTSGTLDIKTFNCNRSVQGGSEKIADSATVIMGALNFPAKFSNYLFTNNSTNIYNGVDSQVVRLSDGIFGNLILRNTGIKTLTSAIKVNGDLTIDNGSNFNGSTQTLTLNGNWVNNGSFIPSTGAVIFSGISKTILGNTSFNKMTVSGTYAYKSNLSFSGLYTVTNTGIVTAGASTFLTVSGDFTNNGGNINDSGTITYTGNTLQTLRLINAVYKVANIYFNGSVSPVLNSSSGPIFGNVTINNTGGVTAVYKWIVNNSFTVGNGAIWNGDTYTHDMFGNVTNNGTITSSGIFNFIPVTAATVNLGTNFSSTGRVIFGGAGAMTMAGTPALLHNVVISNTNNAGITPSSAWAISNNFTVNSGSIFNAGNYTDSVGGKISNSGIINSGTSTFVLNGNAGQDIFTLSNFNNLTLNKAGGSATLSSNVIVSGVLNFISGSIQTGSNVVIQPTTGIVTGAAQNTGWVNGNLQKSIAAGSNISKIFEIGDSTYYTPAAVLFANVSVGGNLTANDSAIDHPQIALSGINKNFDVNRYWVLTNAGISFTTAAATFNWVASDVDAGANTANFKTSVYNGASWGFSAIASPLPTSIQATGLTSMGSFVIGEGPKIATWTGAAGTSDWFTAGNWLGGVPDATIESSIPSTLQAGRFYPVITAGTATIDTITIQNAASLTVSNSTLQIKGAVVNNGTFNASNGTIEMNGTLSQTIAAGTFQNNSVNNLLISNSSSGGVILGGALDVYGSLTYSGGGMKLITNDNLTLKSTAINTAWIGDMTGNTITGKVTVERYLSARKAWRLLSIPTNTIQTIQQSWQEGCGANQNCVVGFGTQITGIGGTGAGFDVATSTPSMKTYNSLNNTWTGVANTTSAIKNTSGYIIFVRGDRAATALTSPVTSTVLRTKGNLYTGDQAPVVVTANKFASIGNPYAASIDMRNLTRAGLKDFFYVWDPNLGSSAAFGGYQLFSYDGSNYIVTPGSGSYGPSGSVNNYLQSGQAFLVQANNAGDGTLTFKESDKNNGLVSRGAAVMHPQMRTALYGLNADNSVYMTDGVLSNYDDSYSNNVDDRDAIKIANISENLSIKTGNSLLMIERRHTITNQDTIFLNLSGTKVQKYRFEFTAQQLSQPGLSGFLEDAYLHTSTQLNLGGSTLADFSIANIAGSYAVNRFRIVFKQLTVLPVTFTSVKAYQQGKNIAVEWKTENESNLKQYDVESSVDGNHYTIAHTVAAKNTVANNYSWLDINPVAGYHYYRIRSTDINGKTAYGTVVKVFMGKGTPLISIYPNPVQNGTINLQLTNQPEGSYGLRLLNKAGQVMATKQIRHGAGSSTETIQLNRYAAHGIYQLEVTGPDGKATNIEVIY